MMEVADPFSNLCVNWALVSKCLCLIISKYTLDLTEGIMHNESGMFNSQIFLADWKFAE